MRGWLVVGLLLALAGSVQAEELSLQYNARIGVERAVNGNYYLAVHSFEAAAAEAREKFVADLAKLLPEMSEGWELLPDNSMLGNEAPLVGGMFASKTYRKDDRKLEVSLIVDSHMLAAVLELGRSVEGLVTPEQFETNATANTFTSQVVKGAFVMVKGAGMTEEEGRDIAGRVPAELLAKLLGVGEPDPKPMAEVAPKPEVKPKEVAPAGNVIEKPALVASATAVEVSVTAPKDEPKPVAKPKPVTKPVAAVSATVVVASATPVVSATAEVSSVLVVVSATVVSATVP